MYFELEIYTSTLQEITIASYDSWIKITHINRCYKGLYMYKRPADLQIVSVISYANYLAILE